MMNKKHLYFKILLTLGGALAIFTAGACSAGTPGTIEKTAAIEQTPVKRNEPAVPAAAEVKAGEVDSLTIETTYKNFFADGDRCRQSYNEYFREPAAYSSPNSPCRVVLTLNRDGRAEKTIEIRRYDRDAKELRAVEKSVWRGKITGEEFEKLAGSIVDNRTFVTWDDRAMVNVVNCTITVKHRGGEKSLMSNAGESTTAYLPLVEVFQTADRQTRWEKAE